MSKTDIVIPIAVIVIFVTVANVIGCWLLALCKSVNVRLEKKIEEARERGGSEKDLA